MIAARMILSSSVASGKKRVFAMRAFIRRLIMHYGIYRRYPLGRLPAFRNAWRNARA
jgi:hypothetical protein